MNPSGCATTSPRSSNAHVEDLDFNPDDFVARVNSDLVGKYVNIASRRAGFIAKLGGGTLADRLPDDALLAELARAAATIAATTSRASIGGAARSWRSPIARTSTSTRTSPGSSPRSHSAAARSRRLLARAQSVSPAHDLSEAGAAQLAEHAESSSRPAGCSGRRAAPLLGRKIARFEPLFQRIDLATLEKLVAVRGLKSKGPDHHAKQGPSSEDRRRAAAEITIEDFAKLDLRIARVIDASGRGRRQAARSSRSTSAAPAHGVRRHPSAYSPEGLDRQAHDPGREPRAAQDGFGVSEGMVLAASGDAGGPVPVESRTAAPSRG